jgi:hypothetical protein
MKAYNIGRNKESNGTWACAYYLLYGELRLIEEGLYELHEKESFWINDERELVSQGAQENCDIISSLIQKIESYKCFALKELQEEEE